MLYIPRTRRIVKPRFGISGRLRGVLINHDTGEVRRYLNRNIITRLGLADIPLSIFQARTAYVTQLAVGSGITTPADTDTALTTQVAIKAITDPIDDSNLTGSTPYVTVTVQFTPSEAIGNLAEAGLKTSTGDLFNHALFGRGTVTGATQADPVVITSAGHGLSTGDRVRFDGIVGMTQLNWTTNGNTYYYVSVLSSSTFSLFTDSALNNSLDGTGFSAWSSGGTQTWTVVVPKTGSVSLYASFDIQAQNA